jgi:hypothetical protein
MDLHKPKPIRNLREFLKEVGIIVLGVSIALAAEQGVERWREHRQYAEARDAMRAELGFDIMNIARRRQEVTPCIIRRIGEIGALLDLADQGKGFTPPSWIGSATTFQVHFAAEAEAGRSILFTPQEQQRYGVLYRWLHGVDVDQDRERSAWMRLRALEGRSRLSPELAAQLRLSLADARGESDRIDYLLAFLLRGAQIYDVALAPRNSVITVTPGARAHCLPINTTPEEAMRRTVVSNQQ